MILSETTFMSCFTNPSNRFRFRALQLCVLGFFTLAGNVSAQNLATNPGFESGSTSGWFAFGPPTIAVQTVQVHSGAYSGMVTNRTSSWNGIAQSFLGVMLPGQTYNLSAWVQLIGGGSQSMQMTIQQTDGSGTSYYPISSSTVFSGGWTQLSGQFTLNVSGSLSGLTLYLEVPGSANAAYYVDDLDVEAVDSGSTNGECTVDWNEVHQRIDGFGASSAWRSTWNATLADLLFSTNNGIVYTDNLGARSTNNGAGLSLLRTRIGYATSSSPNATPGTYESSIMQLAQARGARVWSSPWTPAAGFKSTNNVYDAGVATGNGINGGSFLGGSATNQAYASQLANHVASMKNTYGVNLYAISIQNEPDAAVTSYEACQWTGAQIHSFVTNLYAALVAKGVGATKIVLPESQNWTDPRNLAGPTMNDPNSAAKVGIIANHNYVANNAVGDQTVPAAIASYGKALWETEVALLSGSDSSMANGIYCAQRIHLYLTAAQANAYHYWWLIAGGGSGNEGLLDSNAAITKRLFVFGQFSRFVRPDYYRIGANSSGSVLVSAYKDSISPAFAIVAINPTGVATEETFNLANFSSVSEVMPWITSASLSLASQPAVTVNSNSAFVYTLPAMSVVTFVGKNLANSAPLLAPVADQFVNPGVPILVTNVATDPEVPPQELNFSLLSGPANSTLTADGSGTNGVFAWRPPAGLAGTTNPIVVQVSDGGSPGLTATNFFNIIVNPLVQPVLGGVTLAGHQVALQISGGQGPDYTLLTSTNLLNWQPILSSNSPVTPFVLVDTNSDDAARFYRIQLSP